MTNEEKIRLLENEKRLLVDQIKKLKKEKDILKKELDKAKDDLADIEDYIDLKRCDSCGKLMPETIMSYVCNEQICESCRVNGYGL